MDTYELDSCKCKVAKLEAENERWHSMATTLHEALLSQSIDGCWCLKEDYQDLVEKYGADHVLHSEYCQAAMAASAGYKKLRGDA
jgi:hypothetical protein